jgi:hemolysin-activating ACP:hemolysin acyltransferase
MTQAHAGSALNGKAKTKSTKAKAEVAMSESTASTSTAKPEAAPTARNPRETRQARYAHAFSQIVAVMMRDPKFRQMRLMELEWLVIPPLIAGQWRLAQAKAEQMMAKPGETMPQSNIMVPVGAAIWARVSPEIDKRLSENLDKPLQLKVNEWASGNQIWLIAAMGDPRAMPTFLQSLQESEFKDHDVKLRAPGPDGKVVVSTLKEYTKMIAAAAKAPQPAPASAA